LKLKFILIGKNMPKDKDKKEKAEKKATKTSGKGERFADMSEGAVIIDETAIEKSLEAPQEVKKGREPKIRGKQHQAAKKLVDQNKAYPPKEALELVKKTAFGQFNGTVEVHLNVLEKGLSGEVTLPHFSGKARRVVIFNDEVANEIKAGKVNFDVLLASPTDMPKILPLAKTLGPKGLMPNPKNGTLVPDPEKALKNFSGNALHYQTEKDFPIIHTVIGKVEQPTEELLENYQALVKAVNPKNIKKAVVKSTMGPGIKAAL
jgi:large subunit ribosomal protein L1